MAKPTLPPDSELDPTYRHTRREALIILLVWAVCLTWTVGYSTTHGYAPPDGPIAMVLGMPAWVFWGVLTPWTTATVFTAAFALLVIKQDDLGDEEDTREGGEADDHAEAPGLD